MKNIYINLLLLISLGFSYGQIDRSNPPVSGPMPSIELGTPIEFQLKNGLRVLMVENKKLPRVTANLLIDNPPFSGSDKNGIYSMTSSILGKGTESISKDVFVEKIDFMGASLSINAGGAFASSISRFFPTVLEMMADGALNPLFSQDEFEKEKAKTIEGIKSNAKSVGQIARRVENVLAFGKDHPNGKYITEESVNNISLDDVKSFYSENYTPNNAYLVIIGDFNPKEVQKSVKNLFSKWKKAKNISSKKWTDAKESKNLTLNFVDDTTQTTFSVDDTTEVIEALQEKFPNIQSPKKSDICYATQNRQDSVKEVIKHSEILIVIGSKNSSNSNRLCFKSSSWSRNKYF